MVAVDSYSSGKCMLVVAVSRNNQVKKVNRLLLVSLLLHQLYKMVRTPAWRAAALLAGAATLVNANGLGYDYYYGGQRGSRVQHVGATTSRNRQLSTWTLQVRACSACHACNALGASYM